MKYKYQGMFSVGMMAALLLAISGYYYSGSWQKVPTRTGPIQAPIVDGWMPSNEQIKAVQRLSHELSALAQPSSRGTEPSPLLLFGQSSSGSVGGRGGGRLAGITGAKYKLSMTLLAGPIRYCIVDGIFKAEGELLADGASVVKIENQKVLIANEHRVEWIYLEEDVQVVDRKGGMSSPPREGQS